MPAAGSGRCPSGISARKALPFCIGFRRRRASERPLEGLEQTHIRGSDRGRAGMLMGRCWLECNYSPIISRMLTMGVFVPRRLFTPLLRFRESRCERGDFRPSGATARKKKITISSTPQFHFSPQQNWTNAPNGLVFFEGEYHLLVQYNPFG